MGFRGSGVGEVWIKSIRRKLGVTVEYEGLSNSGQVKRERQI